MWLNIAIPNQEGAHRWRWEQVSLWGGGAIAVGAAILNERVLFLVFNFHGALGPGVYWG